MSPGPQLGSVGAALVSSYMTTTLQADKCVSSCNRSAGPPPEPPPPTPEEVRASVLSELAELFEDADPVVFWAKYVCVGDLAELLD